MTSLLGSWPLRARLVAVVLALLSAGLLVSGVAAVAALRGYLIGEVDRGLAEVARHAAGAGSLPPVPLSQPELGPTPSRPAPVGQEQAYVQYSDASGAAYGAARVPAQAIDPPELPELTWGAVSGMAGEPYVVASAAGSTRWRVLTVPLADGSGSVTAALDIGGIDATVTRLALIELAVGGIVLLVAGLVGWRLVRRSLRPLVGVEHAAAAIAAGDLARRAPAADPRTEVGSLSESFNTMVDALHDSLAAQQASERRALASAARARESEQQMRQFVADASHELRTPLTSVLGFAELYRMGALPDRAALDDSMGRIEAEAARMGVLVEDLLLLARLDRRRPLDRTEVDLLEVVADAVAAARAAAPDRLVSIDLAPGTGSPTVLGDPLRLRQVVDNLVSNALRYSPAGDPVVVHLAGPAADQGAGTVRIDVVDRGPGMTTEEAARVFERFYRADPARTRSQGGAGLGLAIVSAIVAAHGGRVGLATSPGAGATFTILLPGGSHAQRWAQQSEVQLRPEPVGGTTWT